jgi:hypothetical protein
MVFDKNALLDEQSIENFLLYVNLNSVAGYCGAVSPAGLINRGFDGITFKSS